MREALLKRADVPHAVLTSSDWATAAVDDVQSADHEPPTAAVLATPTPSTGRTVSQVPSAAATFRTSLAAAHLYVSSASLFFDIIERKRSWNRVVAYPVCRSVCRSVRKVYCGKTADLIWMPFRVVSGVSRGIGVLDGW